MAQERTRIPSPASALDIIRSVYAFWGRHPGLYAASDYVTFLGRPHSIRRRAVRALGKIEGTRVLEIGCGTGRNLPFIRDAVGESGSVLGLDYSFDMLSAAKRLIRIRGWNNVHLVQGDAERMNVHNSSLDGILSVLALSAVPGWSEALVRCYEMLRPGGMISVCDACLFQGVLSFLNPLIKALYRRFAAWDPSRDIPNEMHRVFRNVHVMRYNLGTFFVATSAKPENTLPNSE